MFFNPLHGVNNFIAVTTICKHKVAVKDITCSSIDPTGIASNTL